MAPKDRVQTWNIVTGDKVKKWQFGRPMNASLRPSINLLHLISPNLEQVAIIAGKDKDTIGEIKSVDRKRNLVVVDGKKLVWTANIFSC